MVDGTFMRALARNEIDARTSRRGASRTFQDGRAPRPGGLASNDPQALSTKLVQRHRDGIELPDVKHDLVLISDGNLQNHQR